jgi:hypothetical protein
MATLWLRDMAIDFPKVLGKAARYDPFRSIVQGRPEIILSASTGRLRSCCRCTAAGLTRIFARVNS